MATIYTIEGELITDGMQSGRYSDECRNAAREIARSRRQSVLVRDEEGSLGPWYRVGPRGGIYHFAGFDA